MKFTSGLILVACLAITQAAPLFNAAVQGSKLIPDSYIVVLKANQTVDGFQSKFDNIARRQNGRGKPNKIGHRYGVIPGFAATLNPAALKELLATEEVDFIEQDQIVTLSNAQYSPPSWGLSRVSERNLDLSQPYLYNSAAGNGVTAYVIDTGINTAHVEFQGRASMGANFVSGAPNTDDNGHGSHVSGTIGGATYGVAKAVTLVGVKVLDAAGSGSYSGIIAGMDWVTSRARGTKAVVNMSLGGGASAALNQATTRMYNAGIPLIVAAGNDANADACNGAPSGSPGTFTVAASDRYDQMASFSSWGQCVNIFGPGVNIVSAWKGSSTATNTISGTSMATPHVVGVSALLISFQPNLASASALYNYLSSTSTNNKITGNLRGSPNQLVFNQAA